MTTEITPRIILAADGLGLPRTKELVDEIGARLYAVKIHDLLDEHGPAVIKALGAPRVWADVKLHDIPRTVGLRALKLAEAGASIITVHASGGIDMMNAAEIAAIAHGAQIFAVTALTSIAEEDVHLTFGASARAAVLKMARDAKMADVDGIVCSAQEVGLLSGRFELGGLKFITPGVRSPGQSVDDQKRVDTPANAIKNGADYLVVGSQLITADSPSAMLDQIEAEIAAA